MKNIMGIQTGFGEMPPKQNIGYRLTRIGRVVDFLLLESASWTFAGTNAIAVAQETAIPARFRPDRDLSNIGTTVVYDGLTSGYQIWFISIVGGCVCINRVAPGLPFPPSST